MTKIGLDSKNGNNLTQEKNLDKEVILKINRIISEGKDKLHIITDFDRTLTITAQGKKGGSSFAVLREGGIMPKEYIVESGQLYEYYRPIETATDLTLKVKQEKMAEWWTKHAQLMARFGMTKTLLESIADNPALQLREGCIEFFKRAESLNIPILIFSAGLGDVIKAFLKKHLIYSKNVHILSNFYTFDEKGKAIGYEYGPIHSLNKNEVVLKDTPYAHEIKKRPHVLLMGDTLEDARMAAGVSHDTVLKICFLNEETARENLKPYKDNFDIILNDKSSMELPMKILEQLS